jgi:biotin operon repressor
LADDDQIPALARELIKERIHSIEALEVVLALRERKGQPVAYAELSATLRISESSVDSALDELRAGGLVVCQGGKACYQPAPQLEPAVASLVETYAQMRVETLVLISKNAIGRVRNDALRTFSEAFRLRGRKDDG